MNKKCVYCNKEKETIRFWDEPQDVNLNISVKELIAVGRIYFKQLTSQEEDFDYIRNETIDLLYKILTTSFQVLRENEGKNSRVLSSQKLLYLLSQLEYNSYMYLITGDKKWVK